MTWTKLSDDFSDDCYRLSAGAFRLHVEGLIWSNRKLLDLRLEKSEMRRWATDASFASDLVDVGWWEDKVTYYLVVHHGAYQRSRDAVVKQQKANQRNGRKGGRPSREQANDLPSPESDSVSESQSESETERDGTGRAGTNGGSPEALPLAAGAEWPTWKGAGPNPFNEYT